VLANAIYFNADWNSRFDEEATYEEPFHLLDGGQESVPMMHQTAIFPTPKGLAIRLSSCPTGTGSGYGDSASREGQFRDVEERSTGEWCRTSWGIQ